MFNKTIQAFKINDFNTLNYPEGDGWKIFEGNQELSISKIASLTKDKQDTDLNGFNLEAEIKSHPDWLYFKAFAIKKDEPNDNGDAFSEEELVKSAHTFIGVPVFTNHQNDDIEKARGKVVHSWYDYDKGGIWLIAGVDKVAYPTLARGIEQTVISGTSMGCFTGKMRVLMSDGTYKPIENVQFGDLVITHKGNIKPVKNVQIHEDKTNNEILLLDITGNQTIIESTKEHPFYVLKPQDRCFMTGEFLKINQKNKNIKYKKRAKLGAYQMKGYAEKNKEAQENPYEFMWKEAKDLEKGDYVSFPICKEEIITGDATEEKAKLIGYFISEGNFMKYKGKIKEVEFTFSIEEKDTLAKETFELLKKAFPNENSPRIYIREDKNDCVVRIYSEKIANWFKYYCGEYSFSKKLHQDCLFWPINIQKHLVSAMINGDGHLRKIIDKKHNKEVQDLHYTTVSENLHYQLKFLLSRLGIFSTEYFGEARNNYRKNYTTTITLNTLFKNSDLNNYICLEKQATLEKTRDSVFRKTNDYIISPIRKIERKFNTEKVYNLEVEDDNSFIIEGVAVHNCQVGHSTCSICHNCASVAEHFCSHIKNQKTRKFSGKVKCQYHSSKYKPKDKCPVCGCKAGEESFHEYKEAKVYEHNYELKFIEDSLVVNPACGDCLIECVINPAEFLKQANNAISQSKKIIAQVENKEGNLVKVAGKQEIQYLNDAMKRMEVVAKSMMDQKEQVSLEYVSDIIDVLASLQTSVDELVEMGYGQLPSSPNLQDPENVGNAVNPEGNAAGVQSTPQSMQPSPAPMQPQQSINTLPSSSSNNSSTSNVNGIGTVTKPTFSASADKKIKDFIKLGDNIIKNRAMADFKHKFTKDMITAVLHSDETGNDYVSVFEGDSNLLRTAQVNLYPKLSELYENSPDLAALTVIEDTLKLLKTNKESQMSDNIKTAAGKSQTAESVQQITEKQLDSNLDLHPREESAPEVITNKQLSEGEAKKDVPSESPQKNKDNSPEVTTEKQFEVGEGPISRWGEAPEVITEKQWTDFNRAVGAELKDTVYESITQSQLQDLLSHHRWTDPEVITEKQLSSGENWLNTDNAWLDKKAAAAYSRYLVASAINSLADAIAYYKITPTEAVKAAKTITNTPQNQIKAAFLTLVNGLPTKVNERKAQKSRNDYFHKVAGTVSAISSVDALIASMSDNCKNIKTEDLVEAVKHIATNPEKMAKIEQIAQSKMAQSLVSEDSEVDKLGEMDTAFNDLESQGFKLVNKSKSMSTNPDATGKEKTTITETTTYEKCEDENSETADIGGLDTSVVEDSVIEDSDIESDIDSDIEDDGLTQVRSTVDEVGANTDDEAEFIEAAERFGRTKLANSENHTLYSVEYDPDDGIVFTTFKENRKLTKAEKRNSLVKKAQGMGGQMGPSGAGAPPAPGAGATLPTPPMDPNAAGGNEVPPVESLGGVDADPLAEDTEKKETPPVGTICPLCGSEDVDVISGKHRCNACGNKFITKIVTESIPEDEKNDGTDLEEEGEGDKGLALGDENAMPNIPVAASALIRPDLLKKFADRKLGSVSPITGSTNTVEIDKNNWLCMDSGLTYNVDIVSNTKEADKLEVTWSWTPKFASYECESCNRTRKLWTNALKTANVSEKDFNDYSLLEKANTVLAMQSKGLFRTVKTASKSASVVEQIKNTFKFAGKFPIESCREKIARRFGDNAIALSGPNKGENLADCVCNQLKNANVYSDKLAIKVADTWSDRDACIECMEDVVKLGLNLDQAATACQYLKAKYASNEELFAEELTDQGEDTAPDDDFSSEEPVESNDFMNDSDFSELENLDEEENIDLSQPEGEVSGDTVKVELPLEVINKIEEAIDKVHGEDPSLEPHHDISGHENDEVEIELPADSVEGLEEATEEKLEEVTETTPEENEISLENGENKEGLDSEVVVDTEDKEISPMSDIENEKTDDVEFSEEVAEDNDDTTEFEEEVSDEDDETEFEDEDSEEEDEETESNDSLSDEEKEEAFKLSSYMRKGYQNKVGEINLDLSSIIEALNKTAESEGKKPKLQKAQDSVGKIQDGKTIGNEEKFDAKKPEVPAVGAKAEINQEKDLHPGDELPDVFTGDANLGHEKEQGYTSDGASLTGGDKGQGKSEITTTSSGKKQVKMAEDKKVGPVKPVSKEIPFKIQDNKDLAKSGNPITPDEGSKTEVKVEEKGEGAFIGHEKESLEFVPKADKTPSIPAGGGKNPKFDKNDNDPEKQTNIKGTIIASEQSKSEAIRLAGKMLENKIITANDLVGKISELQQYGLGQLKDIESAMFRSASKGLQNTPDGLERAVFVPETSQSNSLVDQLQEMFTLGQQNREAGKTTANLKKTFRR